MTQQSEYSSSSTMAYARKELPLRDSFGTCECPLCQVIRGTQLQSRDGLTLAMSMFASSPEEAGDYREDSRERFFMNSGVSPSAVGAQRHSVSPRREPEMTSAVAVFIWCATGKAVNTTSYTLQDSAHRERLANTFGPSPEETPASSAPQRYEPQVRGIRSVGP